MKASTSTMAGLASAITLLGVSIPRTAAAQYFDCVYSGTCVTAIGTGNYDAGYFQTTNVDYGAAFGWDKGTGAGVMGISSTGIGVLGVSNDETYTPPDGQSYGGYFYNAGGTAVYGNAAGSGGTGVQGSGYGYGLYGSSTGTYGVGVYGTASAGNAILGVGTSSNGNYAGVVGENTGAGYGVYGSSASTYGVRGSSTSSYGVYGSSTNEGGVYGASLNDYSGTAGVNAASSGSCSGVAGCAGVYGLSTYGPGVYAETTSGSYAGYFKGNLHVTGAISCGSGCTSDARLKKNIGPLSGALDQLLELRGVTYQWVDPKEHNNDSTAQRGFIAQDVEKVFPSWVDKNGYTSADGQVYRTLDLRQIEALEVESIRTLKTENDLLRDRVAALEGGRRLLVSGINLNGVGGLAMAGALLVSRRRREPG